MGLSLVLGPAHTGKVALLLDRFLESLERDPWLVVPNRVDVERVERDLLRRQGALLAGRIGTFDDVFEHLAQGTDASPVASEAQALLALRRAISGADLGAFAASAGSSGFADAVHATLGELGSALLEPDQLEGDLRVLATAYRAELERLGLQDRAGLRRAAVDRLSRDLDAWRDEPFLAYGFEDLTGIEWALVEALAARTDVTLSIPYEPGRAAFVALERTVADLAGLAQGDVVELPPDDARLAPASLRLVERRLFTDAESATPELDGSITFLEGAGLRGSAELVGKELRDLLVRGVPAERIALVCDTPERWRAVLGTVLEPLGIPYEIEHGRRLGETALGRALLALLRFDWLGGGRPELFAFLRSPYSGLERRSVDYVEGRLRGRAVVDPVRVEQEAERHRGASIPALGELRAAAGPTDGVRALVQMMVRNAWGLEAPPTGHDAREDARAAQAATQALDELDALAERAQAVSREEVIAALERVRARPTIAAGERGHVAVLDYTRVRTRAFDVVFLLGLEEGGLPRRDRPSALLDEDARSALGGRLELPNPVSRDRYLFYTACTRAARQLVLVRQATTEDGVPREPSPFWDEVTSLFDSASVARHTRRRSLAALTWPLEEAPSERDRLRSLARIASESVADAEAIAAANGWSRRFERARDAFTRTTRLQGPATLEPLATRTMFPATELERFADCSAAWLVERVIDPKKIDAEPDPMLRGSVMHTALHRFYAALPRELHDERVTPENVEAAIELVRRCVDDALESGVRFDLTDLQAAELRQTLVSDLEAFVRDEAASGVSFVPRRLEVGFGSERSAPELQRGLSLGDGLFLSGKIDRIDVDPFSARGIVQDYKSGKGAHSAREIERELRLQIPLYVLALRDLVGVEPLGGVYRALAGRRTTRGMLRESAKDDLPGFAKDDYLDEETFWAQVEVARERASTYAQRIRAGDVRHDPKGGECPAWCDLWTICRVERS
ncbi:MAG: PD-(D/E)XK nuclease family protein [Gaiellaceae bacterium]